MVWRGKKCQEHGSAYREQYAYAHNTGGQYRHHQRETSWKMAMLRCALRGTEWGVGWGWQSGMLGKCCLLHDGVERELNNDSTLAQSSSRKCGG